MGADLSFLRRIRLIIKMNDFANFRRKQRMKQLYLRTMTGTGTGSTGSGGPNTPLLSTPNRHDANDVGRGTRKELSELDDNQLPLPPVATGTEAATKTPLRGNVSVKFTSCLQTSRTITSKLCCSDTFNAHIITGPRGVGKTFVAHNAIQADMAKEYFSDGIVWIGLGNRKPLNFYDLIEIYERIYFQIYPSRTMDFDKVIFIPPEEPDVVDIDDEGEIGDEKMAMLKARDIMANVIARKKILICVDDVFDAEDVHYFQFDLEVSSEVKCRVLATTGKSTISNALHSGERVKFWQLSPMNVVESRKFFLRQISSEARNHSDFIAEYYDCHQSCHGNPRCIIILSRMIDDKLKGQNYKSLKKFVSKFVNAPLDPKMKAYIVLESMFSHSSLGENHTKLAWRCFAAFTTVFTRSDNYRPFIPSSPCKALFRAIVSRVGKITEDPGAVNKVTDKITEFMVDNGLFVRIDGFDDQKLPHMFYQVSCDIYQEFGQELSTNSQTHRKLNELLINEYTTMFNGMNTAFGSNEIDFYMLRLLPEHSVKANELEDASLTLQDSRFIEERLKYLGVKNGCKKHIDDAKKLFLAMGGDKGGTKVFHLVLTKALQSCADVLEIQYRKKVDRKITMDWDTMINSIWDLTVALLREGLVRSGCKILHMANGLAKNEKERSKLLDPNLIENLIKTPSDNKKQCSRAMILIGSAMAQRDIRLRDSIQMLHNGLMGLEKELGYGHLEVARAKVYVGEILYRDFKLYDRALQKFRQALPTFMTDLGEDSEELYDAIILVGKSCIHTGDLDTALDILRNLSPKLSGTIALDVDIKVGYIYIIKGDHESALSILSKAKEKTTDDAIIQRIDQMIEKSVGEKGRYTI